MPERINRIHWVVILLTTGILLILQGVLELDWIVLLLVSLPLMLLTPTRDEALQWSLRKKTIAFAVTLVLLGAICCLVWLAGGNAEVLGRVILVVMGSGFALIGLILFVRSST